jgi:putative flippase GtrA
MKSLSGVHRSSGDFSNPADLPAVTGEVPGEGTGQGAIRRLLRSRFVRFLLVGGLNTAFGYTVFAICILIGIPYPLAALVSTVLGVLFNFKSYGALVFASHDNRLIFRFIAVYGVCYVVGLVPLAWAKAHGVPILWMAAICVLPMAALAFTLQRVLVFHRSGGMPGLKPSS